MNLVRSGASVGSSPLARGTSQVTHLISLEVRLIPARAGSTKLTPVTPAVSAAHPRSRGEHPSPGSPEITIDGSSPLARGTRTALFHPLRPARLIPARAGNTRLRGSGILWRSAHPRSRGEHDVHFALSRSFRGSSPLARGPPSGRSTYPVAPGLIPALAGSTHHQAHQKSQSTAHPRSRGEHPRTSPTMMLAEGSSPLAQGTSYCPCRFLG